MKKKTKKRVFVSIFVTLAIVMAYLFVVVYFHAINPLNISAKVSVWPFFSKNKIMDFCSDAVVNINFSYNDEQTFSPEEQVCVGVNIDQNGLILASYKDVCMADESSNFKISVRDGEIFDGKLIFQDKDLNLALFKCEKILDDEKPIKIPFASISKETSSINEGSQAFLFTPSNSAEKAKVQTVDFTGYSTQEVDTRTCVKEVAFHCFEISLSTLFKENSGAVFDRWGHVLGFYLGKTDEGTVEESLIVSPAYLAQDFIDKVKADQNFEPCLYDEIVGLDRTELLCYIEASKANENTDNAKYFMLKDQWWTYNSSMEDFADQSSINGVFLVDDLSHNGQVVPQNSIITSVEKGGKTFYINSKLDLLEFCFDLSENDEIKFTYYENYSAGSSFVSTKILTV